MGPLTNSSLPGGVGVADFNQPLIREGHASASAKLSGGVWGTAPIRPRRARRTRERLTLRVKTICPVCGEIRSFPGHRLFCESKYPRAWYFAADADRAKPGGRGCTPLTIRGCK